MQQWQLPLDGRGPLLQQTRSCAPAREQPSKAPRDRRTTAHNVFGPPPAFPLPICTTPGATARSARRGRDASRAHAHPRRVEPTGFKTGQNKALRHHAKVLNYRLQLSGTLHPFSTKPTTAEKPLEMEERLAYGRKGFINSI